MIEVGKLYTGDKDLIIKDSTVTLRNTKVIVQDENGNVVSSPILADGSASGSTDNDEALVVHPSFSTQEMTQNLLFGIDLSDQSGNPFPKQLAVSYLNSAISWVESLLDICLTPQSVEGEAHDYERQDYTNWGYIQLWKRPVREIKALKLMYGTRPSFDVPLDWLKVDKNGGKIQMFPSSGSATNFIISSTGVIFGMFNKYNYAPQMWAVDYEAGMLDSEIPALLKEVVYKKAAIGVLQVWGDLILGAGIANSSVSIDGLSQSIGTTQSAMYSGASARINDYRQDIEDAVPVLRQKYGTMRMTVL